MSNALLLAEPEAETRGYLERHLTEDGFEVVGAAATSETLDLAERARPDLVLLGIGDGSGLELCRRLREGEPGRSWNRDVPVIVLGQEEADAVDRVRAFARGCDDYVARPFVYDELVARIRAVLRRYGPLPHERLEAGGIVVDRPTRVFTKEQLLRDVWGFRSLGRTRTVDSHASRLRRKLAACSPTPYVLNVWGVGYRLLAPTLA